MADGRMVSSDSHVVEPAGLWTERMDSKFGDRIPHLVQGESFYRWHCGEQEMGVLGGVGANTGERFDNPQEMVREAKFADVRPGGYDPHLHIADIESDGVYGDVVYPSIGMQLYSSVAEPELRLAIFSAYNDWLAEYCSPYPGRLKGVPVIMVEQDVDFGVAQLRRAAEQGFSAAMISAYPLRWNQYDQPKYDPFWAAAEEMSMSLSMHQLMNQPDPAQGEEDSLLLQIDAADRVNMEFYVRLSLPRMVYSGVFERFPKLKVTNVENDAGWLPYFLYSLDRTYEELSGPNP